ncbi:MAG: OmpA family protein [Rhodospirillales bacterium]|nr:OmpA family protein [Rhodospirillales bacterium]QQS15049.1 MAG: OmpA family protein [Rhodospirillales bacterium]
MFWNIGAKAGLDWEVAPLFHIAAGYKVEWMDGVYYDWLTPNVGVGSPRGRSGQLIHGPFVRLAYNWGAPPMGAAPMQPPPPAGKKSYIVFFDFDRALITPTAATTIKQAAADAKAGKSTRLDVTGHADKSGGDAYNMALSLRRANAVKDQLVREGIPANQIAVVGRGESMPLVQTADGVREPQNRRVEIVLN